MQLVADASEGRDRQTISSILNGSPKLGLTSNRPLNKMAFSSTGMQFNLIPRGKFMMGSPNGEKSGMRNNSQHEVEISEDYYLGTFEVTQKQWKDVMKTEPWKGKDGVMYGVLEGDDQPATYISWEGAVEFCQKLSLRDRVNYRLPTEAQWERACRAGSTTRFYFGDDEDGLNLKNYAWFETKKHAQKVGGKKPNKYGLYDMHGNVWEFCSDFYSEDYYKTSPKLDPQGPTEGTSHSERGGCFM